MDEIRCQYVDELVVLCFASPGDYLKRRLNGEGKGKGKSSGGGPHAPTSLTTRSKASTARWLVKIRPPYRVLSAARRDAPSLPSVSRRRSVCRLAVWKVCESTGTNCGA